MIAFSALKRYSLNSCHSADSWCVTCLMAFISTLPIFIFCLALMPAELAVQLHPETDAAFNHYIQLTEQRMDKDLRDGHFLVLGRIPQTTITTQESRTLDNGKELPVPHG